MKLRQRADLGSIKEFYCDLTDSLDELAGLKEKENYRYQYHRHYLLTTDYLDTRKAIAIRVAGGTVGSICLDEENKITDIRIDTGYVVKTYVPDVEKLIRKKYIGTIIE